MYDASIMKEITERNSNFYSELAIEKLESLIKSRAILGSHWAETTLFGSPYCRDSELWKNQIKTIKDYFESLGYKVTLRYHNNVIIDTFDVDCFTNHEDVKIEISWEN